MAKITFKVKIEDLPDLHFQHDDVIKWKPFPRYWPFVRGIHRSPVNSLHKGQWRGALMFSLICFWINGWENNRKAGDLRRYRVHYGVIVMNTLQYEPRVSQDACLLQILWFQFQFVTSYRADNSKFTDRRTGGRTNTGNDNNPIRPERPRGNKRGSFSIHIAHCWSQRLSRCGDVTWASGVSNHRQHDF